MRGDGGLTEERRATMRMRWNRFERVCVADFYRHRWIRGLRKRNSFEKAALQRITTILSSQRCSESSLQLYAATWQSVTNADSAHHQPSSRKWPDDCRRELALDDRTNLLAALAFESSRPSAVGRGRVKTRKYSVFRCRFTLPKALRSQHSTIWRVDFFERRV